MALPSIGRALDLSAAGRPWVVTAYVLMTGGLTLMAGGALLLAQASAAAKPPAKQHRSAQGFPHPAHRARGAPRTRHQAQRPALSNQSWH